MMVTSALTSFSFSWRSILNTFRGKTAETSTATNDDDSIRKIIKKWFVVMLLVVMAISVTLQVVLFDIKAWIAALGVLLTFLLAIVAARVSGETNITPVDAMGKVTQLSIAILAPGSPRQT